VLGLQLFRSGTSVGAQYREACRSKSNADFISKIEGALQELDETMYWLELIGNANIIAPKRYALPGALITIGLRALSGLSPKRILNADGGKATPAHQAAKPRFSLTLGSNGSTITRVVTDSARTNGGKSRFDA